MYKRILISVCIFIVIMLILLNKTSLTSFKIKSFEQDLNNIYTLNTLFFEPSKTAIYYEVRIYDKTNQLLKIYKTKHNYLKIDNLPIINGTEIYFKVVAYDNHGKHKASKNKLNHTWQMPSLKTEDKIITSNTDLNINILGLDNGKYSLLGFKGQEKFYAGAITNSSIKVSASLIGDYQGYLRFYLVEDTTNVIIGTLEVGVNLKEITDIKITYPNSNAKVKWKDFYLTLTGGDNAYYYTLSIKNWLGQYVLYEEEFNTKEILIRTDNLKPSSRYKIIIKAYSRLDYKAVKVVTTNFSFLSKKKALNVVASVKSGEVRNGERLRLVSPDNINVYYTTDGSLPNSNSKKYEQPIIITKDMIIKSIAIDSNYYSSDVTTYNYKAIARAPIVYLSPSTQIQNHGVARAGYTTEREMMNKIADVVEKQLKSLGVIVYRNTQDLRLSEVAKISNGLNADLHLAIHSNAMTSSGKESNVRGVLTFVYDETSPVLEVANVIQKGLVDVYNGPKNSCRIVYGKTFSRNIYEINPANIKNSVLLEIGFHDNYNDALWIVNNIEKIGNAIAKSIVNYFNNKIG